jgi:hypothetical protein
LTAYSPRSLAGSVSHRRRSWDFPFGAFSSRKVSGAFPPRRTHLPFHPPVYPIPKHQAGSTGYGSWVLTLPEVPGGPHVFSTRPAGCSLGFRPSRVFNKSLGGISPDLLPRGWTFRPSHLGVSISSCPGQSGFLRQAAEGGKVTPSRVLHQAASQPFGSHSVRAIGFTLRSSSTLLCPTCTL